MDYIIESLEQGTQAWLDWRRSKVTATDATCIMGINPWCTEYQRWQEKLGLIDEPTLNDAMRRGLALESAARHEFYCMTGIEVFAKCVTSLKRPFLAASLDGINVIHGFIVEIKCPGKNDHESAQCGIVPAKYYPQLQHQLAVTGLDMIYYFSFDGTNGVILTVDRDQDYIDKMTIKENDFYACLMTFKAPELTDRDYTQRNDDQWAHAVQQWKDSKRRLQVAESAEAELRANLLSICGSRNSNGAGVKVQRIIKKGLVNYSEIQELKGVDLEIYRKPATEYWKIGEI